MLEAKVARSRNTTIIRVCNECTTPLTIFLLTTSQHKNKPDLNYYYFFRVRTGRDTRANISCSWLSNSFKFSVIVIIITNIKNQKDFPDITNWYWKCNGIVIWFGRCLNKKLKLKIKSTTNLNIKRMVWKSANIARQYFVNKNYCQRLTWRYRRCGKRKTKILLYYFSSF